MKEHNRKVLAWVLFLISEIFAILTIVFLLSFDGHIHVLVMAITMIVLNGHGLVVFRLLIGVETALVKYIHTIIQLIVLIGAILGVVLILGDNDKGLSLHPYLGFVILALYAIQVIIALFVYLYMYSNQRRRKIFAACHNFLGIVILQLSIVSACIQLQDSEKGDTNADIAVICMVLYGVMINSIVLNPYTEWRLIGPL